MGLCARGRPVRRVPRISLRRQGLASRLVQRVAGLCLVRQRLGSRLVR
jgi:hypothetical protein